MYTITNTKDTWRKRLLGMFALLGFLVAPALPAQSAQEIIQKLEAAQTPTFASIQGSLSLKDRFGDRTITFQSKSRGEDKMLIEFTSDAELGQKILRLGKDLYLYYPDADKTVTLKGSALGDSVLGSDMSYEDLTGNKSLLESYEVILQGSETVLDRDCWVIALKAKVREVAYEAQTLWIDKELNVTRQAHQFARSGRLLRTMQVLEVKKFGPYTLGTRTVLADQLRRGTSTTFVLDQADLTTPVPDATFSMRELGK